jgi:hypothetical protein
MFVCRSNLATIPGIAKFSRFKRRKTKDSKLDHCLVGHQNRKPDPHFNVRAPQTGARKFFLIIPHEFDYFLGRTIKLNYFLFEHDQHSNDHSRF